MKAAIYTKYGPPEVVQITEVPVPVPKDDEVLIKVHASTANRTDCGFRSAEYFIVRFFSGLFKPKNKILGSEFSGEIESIGSKVSHFKPGDRVFGYNDKQFGAHAEFLIIDENGAISIIPENLSLKESAAIIEGSHYALRDLRAAKLKEGQKILVNGATGGIGSAAVQLSKYFGAEVVAVCETKHIELVRSLGADLVIDYSEEDFTKRHEFLDQFDVVFDAVGKSSFKKCKPLLKKGGVYMSTELGKNAENVYLALLTPLFGKKKVLFPIPTINKEDVFFLKDLVEKGKFKPVIDREYKLDDIVEAYRYVETGMKTGNVIITVE